MLGDDPDPSVMTERVGFGTASDTHSTGFVHCTERLRFRKEGKRITRFDLERSTKARGNATTMSGCKFYENMRRKMHDDMMKCNNNRNKTHTMATKNMEGVWSVGLGASQHSSTYKRSRPEI